jgi:acyl dehydratase
VPLSFGEIAVGQKYTAAERIDEAAMDAFRALSGDSNPLHTDVTAARQQGFPGRTIYGFLMLTLLSRIAGGNFRNAVCAAVSADFTQPAFCGDQVTLQAEIVQTQMSLRSAVLKFEMNTAAARVVRGKLTIRFLAGGGA